MICFKLNVIAEDKGDPALRAEITVEVTVIRDRGRLSFPLREYQTRVSENAQVRNVIQQVTASPSVSSLYKNVKCLKLFIT